MLMYSTHPYHVVSTPLQQILNQHTPVFKLQVNNPEGRVQLPIRNQRNHWSLAGTATPWVMEDRLRSVGLAPSWTMRDYLSLARTAKPFNLKQTSRFAGTAYPC